MYVLLFLSRRSISRDLGVDSYNKKIDNYCTDRNIFAPIHFPMQKKKKIIIIMITMITMIIMIIIIIR